MKSPIRVAYVLTPVTFGGAEKVSLNFLSNVDRNQIDVHVIALVRPWEDPPLLLQEVERLGIICSTLPVAAHPRFDPLRILRVVWALYRIFRQQDFDLVHTHGYFADICALPVGRLFRVPAISTCHGYIDTDRKLRLYNRMDLWALGLCKRVLAVSDGIRDGLVETGIEKERIRVIANAVSLPPITVKTDRNCHRLSRQHGISADEFVFVYVGRLSEEKGLCYLLEAFSQLIKPEACSRLVLIGEGPEREKLARRIIELGVAQQVSMIGFQNQVSPWFRIAGCFVLPSLTEGTPMALLEAMAAGIPVVATRVGGVPDVICSGVNGLLVPSADTEALRLGMMQVSTDSQLRDKFGREARKTVESRYSVQPWCQKIQQNYRELCSFDNERL